MVLEKNVNRLRKFIVISKLVSATGQNLKRCYAVVMVLFCAADVVF